MAVPNPLSTASCILHPASRVPQPVVRGPWSVVRSLYPVSHVWYTVFCILHLVPTHPQALRSRARKQRAARKPHLSELTGGSVIENIAQTRRLAETALDSSRHASRILPDEAATNTASGSNEEEDENAISPDIDDCHVIVNDKSTEFMLATVVEETGK